MATRRNQTPTVEGTDTDRAEQIRRDTTTAHARAREQARRADQALNDGRNLASLVQVSAQTEEQQDPEANR